MFLVSKYNNSAIFNLSVIMHFTVYSYVKNIVNTLYYFEDVQFNVQSKTIFLRRIHSVVVSSSYTGKCASASDWNRFPILNAKEQFLFILPRLLLFFF